ncbi:MAG: M20/M25/M40 family metallo-hydrolase [Kiritimatiellae bacterium]|nr:M20/M25/M40 family metallo-hydrolase [Kiritimatiellia bacterium]
MKTDRSFFLDLLRIPSVTDDVPQVNRAVGAMRDWLCARGVFCETETMPDGREILYASVVEGERAPKLLLNAHLDVVPAPAALFEPRIDGDRILGRGTQDCKGNAFAAASALAALSGSGASVGAVFSTDEEEGGETSAVAAARHRATVLTAVLDGGAWSITYAQKGIASFRLVAKGRGGHSSEPWRFDNPIDKLLDGWARVRAAWPAIPEDEWHWGDSIAATVVRGGSVHNQIPDEAEMSVNVRYVHPGDEPRIEAFLRETSGLGVELRAACEPVFCDENAPAVAALRAAMAAAFNREIPMKRMQGATDARHFAGPGAAPVAIIGIEGGACHEEREWASLSSIDAYAGFLADYARTL